MIRIGRSLICFFFILGGTVSSAQSTHLDEYIRIGLESNLVVKQKHVSLDNALTALNHAKYMYIPTLDFQMLYTTAAGGRQIDLPVGDMMNPVYSALNSFIGQNYFPMIENQTINFLPKNYYDARVRLSMPIINSDIIHNQHISKKQVLIQENEVEIYKRELVKEIKSTYYDYLSIIKAIEIKKEALKLALEAKKTNEKLVESGKGLPAYVLRAETEIAQIETEITSFEAKQKSLLRYFNVLLNREEFAEIEIDDVPQIVPFISKEELNVEHREELESLSIAINIREDLVKMKQQTFVPRLNGFADLGSQAEQMKFNDKSMYYMVGLQLTIPIFNGLRNSMQIREAKNNVELTKLQKTYVEQQVNLALESAWNEVSASTARYETSLKQLEMAETYHKLISKGYDAGVNSYIETVDARTQYTSAQLNNVIQLFQLLKALAILERESASYNLPITNER